MLEGHALELLCQLASALVRGGRMEGISSQANFAAGDAGDPFGVGFSSKILRHLPRIFCRVFVIVVSPHWLPPAALSGFWKLD